MSFPESLVFLITGSTDGIGLHTAEKLASLGHTIILHGRNEQRLRDALANVSKYIKPPGKVYSVLGDLSNLKTIRNMANEIKQRFQVIDCLINNAGVFMTSYQQSHEGYEMTFAVNVVAPFLLTTLLKDLLLRSSSPRLINTSSISQSSSPPVEFQLNKSSFNSHLAYEQSKLFDRMLTVHQANIYPSITCLSLDPGTVSTKMLEAGWGCGGIPLDKADDTLWLATTKEVSLSCSGCYYVGRKSTSRHQFSQQNVTRLVEYIENIIH